MRIYLLRRHALVEADEPMEEVVTCGVVIGTSLVVGEVALANAGISQQRDRSCSSTGFKGWV